MFNLTPLIMVTVMARENRGRHGDILDDVLHERGGATGRNLHQAEGSHSCRSHWYARTVIHFFLNAKRPLPITLSVRMYDV